MHFIQNISYVTKFSLTKAPLYIGLLCVTLLSACTNSALHSPSAYAETPEQVLQQYFDNVKKQDWQAVSLLFDKDSLTEFKNHLIPIFIDNDVKEFSHLLFGQMTAPEIKALDPPVFFSAFLKNVFSKRISQGIQGKAQQVIGGVFEGADLQHVLVRAGALASDKKTVHGDWSVISMKLEKNTEQVWRIVIGDKMKRHAHVVKMKLLSF